MASQLIDPALVGYCRKAQANHTAGVLESLDSARAALAACRESLGQPQKTTPPGEALAQLRASLEQQQPLARTAKEQKQFHAAISKLGKAVDKASAGSGWDQICRPIPFDADALNEMIALHLYRCGHFKSAARLVDEAGLPNLPPASFQPLIEIFQVVKSLEERRLDVASAWAEARADQLASIGSTLLFQLARLQFVGIVAMPGQADEQRDQALAFAQAKLSAFTESHLSDVMQLMGSLLWAGQLEQSPYAWLMGEDLWQNACTTLAADGCRLKGIPRESHLNVAFSAGLLALPTLRKMQAVVQASNVDWNSIDELPDQVTCLNDDRFSFHSIFSCPLSREQTSAENPPVLLRCGHVICRNAMEKLPRTGQGFKCPTCPIVQKVTDTRPLYF